MHDFAGSQYLTVLNGKLERRLSDPNTGNGLIPTDLIEWMVGPDRLEDVLRDYQGAQVSITIQRV